MKAISIRNVPDDVYSALHTMARDNHRSLQEQVKYILEQEVRLSKGSSMAKAKEWRDRLKKRQHSDTVLSVREDRQR